MVVETAGWHLLRGKEQTGPYPLAKVLEVIEKNILKKTDYVWRQGWPEWRPAGSVPELFGEQQGTVAEPNAPTIEPVVATPGGEHRTPPPVAELKVAAERASAAATKPAGNYLVRHWRGDLSLPVSYWLNGLLVLIVAWLIDVGFESYFEYSKDAPGAGIAAAVVLLAAAIGALTTWQLVGIWRSASRHTGRDGYAFWAVLAKVMVVIGAGRAVFDLATFVPIISEHVKIAIEDNRFGKPAFGPATPTAAPDRLSEILPKLREIDPETYEELTKLLADGRRRGATEQELMRDVQELFTQRARHNLVRAPDAIVLESADIMIAYLEGLKNTDVESCVAFSDATKGARLRVDLTKQFPDISKRELAMNSAILQAVKQSAREIPTQAQAEPLMSKIIDRLAARPEIQLGLFDKNELAPAEYEPHCNTGLAFYQEIRKLPSAEAVLVLRYFYSSMN